MSCYFLVNEIVYIFKFQVIALSVLTMDLPHNIKTSWNWIQLKYENMTKQKTITLHAQNIQKKIMVLTFHSNISFTICT